MINEFDELAKRLAQYAVRQSKLMRYGAFLLLASQGLAQQLPGMDVPNDPVPKTGLVPLLPVASVADTSGDESEGPGVKLHATGLGPLLAGSHRRSAAVVYVDPSQIIYPVVVPSTATAAPAGPDIQVNEPALDNIQVLPSGSNPYPWEFATQSETTLATDGDNIVISYNSSAHTLVVKAADSWSPDSHFFANLFYSGYSVSHDGGQTWRSSYIPSSQSSMFTLGDGVVAKDRCGNFYYASMALDAAGNQDVIVSKSADHGDTFATAQIVALDPGADKEWIAAGPDPTVPSRDNIYVTWRSLGNNNNSTVAFSRSTDGGITWSPPATLFAYTNDGVFKSFVHFITPVVDQTSGRLYVTFVHFGVGNSDYLRVLVSNDGGITFAPLAFNAPGAPNALVYPFVAPGILADCGNRGGTQLVVKQGPDIGGGIWSELYGIPRYLHCSRIQSFPLSAAANGQLVIALGTSTSAVRGDPAGQAQIATLCSRDGGSTWFPPVITAGPSATDPQHFLPAIALTPDGSRLYLGYYVQQSDERVRTELATLQITGGGLQLLGRQALSSVAFDLEPNNIPSPFPPLKSEDTINFDQLIRPGYALGEYMGVATDANGNPMASWGDCRNSWTSPADGFYPGVHPQTDVFFVKP